MIARRVGDHGGAMHPVKWALFFLYQGNIQVQFIRYLQLGAGRVGHTGWTGRASSPSRREAAVVAVAEAPSRLLATATAATVASSSTEYERAPSPPWGGGGEGHARSTRIRGAGCGGGQRNVPRAAVARPSATPAAAAKGAQPAGRSGPHSFVAVHGGRGGLWARDGRHWRPKRRGPDRLSAHRDPHPAAQPPRRRDRSRRPAAVGRPSKKIKNCSSPQRRRRASQRAPPPPHPTPPPAGGATRVPARVPAAQSVRCRHDPRVTMTKMATKQSTAYATPVAAVRPARRPTR